MERSDHPHPLRTRLAHWTNAAVLTVLLWSGFAMFAADRHFAPFVHLLPAWFWSALQLTGHRMQGRAWHLGMAIVFMANGLVYVAGALRTGRFRRTWSAVYHAPQRLVYAAVLAGAGVMVLTGLALWFKKQAPWLLAALGGERIALPAHIIIALLLIAFVAVHVVQVLRAGLPTLLPMITGSADVRPRGRRRALAYAMTAVLVLGAGVIGVRTTSGPTGIPAYLRWAVPARPGSVVPAPLAREEDRRSDG